MTAAARKMPLEAPQAEPRRPSVHEFLLRGLEGADVEGFVQAAKKYEGDAARELADLEAGRHPLQRRTRTKFGNRSRPR